jgi:predicted transposase/invertase (TIGR01784 family)
MSAHDNAYKHLFSHPQAVRDLLRGFVEEDWVALLDFDTLEKVAGSYVTDDLRDREDDLIWRIRMKGAEADEWLYVYLLLEFQSSVDTFMAVRILTYIGLLYQDLIKTKKIKGGKLPPVFPLVLYNGMRAWNAEREVENLIEAVPASLAAYRPSLRYFLLDEGRVSEESLNQPDNAVARLVEIERLLNPEDLAPLIEKLKNQLNAPQNTELRRAFTVWINRVVLKRFTPLDNLPELHDLPEVQEMIEERIEMWKQNLVQQGEYAGILKGKLEGKQEGQAQLLLRFLMRRFGVLPPAVVMQINAATHLEQIETWFDAAMDAPHLAAVFPLH